MSLSPQHCIKAGSALAMGYISLAERYFLIASLRPSVTQILQSPPVTQAGASLSALSESFPNV